jgi:hypothetical protein
MTFRNYSHRSGKPKKNKKYRITIQRKAHGQAGIRERGIPVHAASVHKSGL